MSENTKEKETKEDIEVEPLPIPPWYDTTIPQWFKDFINPPLTENQATAAGPGNIPANMPGLSRR